MKKLISILAVGAIVISTLPSAFAAWSEALTFENYNSNGVKVPDGMYLDSYQSIKNSANAWVGAVAEHGVYDEDVDKDGDKEFAWKTASQATIDAYNTANTDTGVSYSMRAGGYFLKTHTAHSAGYVRNRLDL